MKYILDEAIILNLKDISSTNVLVNLFCKNLGKIQAICFNFRNSKKRELSSLVPLSLSELELEQKNSTYTIKNSTLLNNFSRNINSIYKLQVLMYIIKTLDILLPTTYVDIDLYEKIKEIMLYIYNIEENKFKEKKYIYFLLITFLRRLMIELSIFDIEEISKIYSLDLVYNKYINSDKDFNIIDENELIFLLSSFEKYISSYFSVKLNFKNIFK